MSFLQLIDRENQYMIMNQTAKRKNYHRVFLQEIRFKRKIELVRILLIDCAICLFTV